MVKLIIEDDEGKTTVVPLIRDEITIGRKEGNTIRLTERNVSRRHAKLVKQNGAIFIEDLDSYNGIKVNGNRISGRVAITEGDRIQIGDYVLGLKLEGAEKAAEPFQPGQTVKLPRTADAPTAQIDPKDSAAAVDQADAPPPAAAPAAPAQETDVHPENMGRLVCLSNNFPGQEWVLDKPIMVVGRTDDNDIVINHRSISRHHARVTEENGRYTIVDMQSSNGVRVNGEEYGKVELRRGDLIDLGHVRLRFVAPGEDFVFSRDASVVDISKGGGSRGGLYTAIVVVAVLAVVIVVWRLGKSDSGDGNDGKQPVANADTQPSSGQEAAPDPAVLLAKISQAVGSEQWGEAIETCQQLSGEAKNNAEANCAKAQLEKEASERFEAAHKASLQNKYEEVLVQHGKIPEESVYKKRDLHVVENAKTKYLAQAMKTLDDLLKARDCEEARKLGSRIKELDPANTDVEQKTARCGAVAVAPQPKVRTPRPKTKKPVVRPPPPPPEQPTAAQTQQAKTLLKQARTSYVAGKHAYSIQQAKQVLKLMPGNPDAIQIIGAASCYLKQAGQAKWAYDRLRPAVRNLVRNICIRNGINLE